MNDDERMGPTDSIDAEMAALLSDPSLWAQPSDELEARVVQAITSEATSEATSVVPIGRKRSAWPSRIAAGLIGAAAAAALVVVLVPRDEQPTADGQVQLVGTDLATDASGGADVYLVESGVAIEFSVTGLPRRDGGDFYQGWLKNCDGTLLVPIGSFHDLNEATGWAGVDVADFPILTVTRESAAPPQDVLQGSSGEMVLSGNLGGCDVD
jgi:Anti-sigma-K factor rskA